MMASSKSNQSALRRYFLCISLAFIIFCQVCKLPSGIVPEENHKRATMGGIKEIRLFNKRAEVFSKFVSTPYSCHDGKNIDTFSGTVSLHSTIASTHEKILDLKQSIEKYQKMSSIKREYEHSASSVAQKSTTFPLQIIRVPVSLVRSYSKIDCGVDGHVSYTVIAFDKDIEVPLDTLSTTGCALIDTYLSKADTSDTLFCQFSRTFVSGNRNERKRLIAGTTVFKASDPSTYSWPVPRKILQFASIFIRDVGKVFDMVIQEIPGIKVTSSFVDWFMLSISPLIFQRDLYFVTSVKWMLLTLSYNLVSVDGMKYTNDFLELLLTDTIPEVTTENSISTLLPSMKSWIQISFNVPATTLSNVSNLIATDDLGRRYFPQVLGQNSSSSSSVYPPIPNCTAHENNAGCLKLSKSHQLGAPHWSGKIHATPSYCNETEKKCEQGIPMSVRAYSLSDPLVSINPFTEESVLQLPSNDGTLQFLTVADVNGDNYVDVIIGQNDQNNQLILNEGNDKYSAAIDLPGGVKDTYSIAVADVNNDDMIDMIVSNRNQTNQLLINEGGGNYSEVIDLPGGDLDTRSIAVADANNDGMADIIIGNKDQKNQLLLNDGDGSYSEAVDLPGGSLDTRSIATADVNNDGMVDIIIGNYGHKNQLLLNEGGRYSEAVDLPGGYVATVSIVVADVDGDGIVDILIGNSNQENQLLINQGAGPNYYLEIFTLPGGPLDTTVITGADINGDGMVDIIVGNFSQDNHLLLNQGDSKFSEAIVLAGYSTWSKAVADMNNDGMVDIVIGGLDSIQIMINKNDGDYTGVADLPGDDRTSTSFSVLADVNADGMPDTVIGNFLGVNHLLINQGDGSYSETIELPGGAFDTSSIAVGDLDNDGAVDIVIGNRGKLNQLLINRQGSGNYIEEVINLPGGAMETTSIVSSDINGDGLVDIIIGNIAQPNQLLINEGNGMYSKAIDLPGGDLETADLAAADMNNDGIIDIVIGNWGHRNQLLLNEGDGSFSEAVELSGTSLETISISVVDTDGDGMLDVIIGTSSQTSNQLLLNDGDGTFSTVIDLPGGQWFTASISTSDINGDGMPDILIGNFGAPNQLLINQGGGIFSDAIDLPGTAISDTFRMLAIDVNNDGMMDILCGNFHDQTNQLLINQNNSEIFEDITLPGGAFKTGYIAAEDVNEDGMVDILTANVLEKNQLLINQGDGRHFEVLELPGGNMQTWSMELVDVNNDGMVDILLGNRASSNQLLINQGNGRYSTVIVDLPGGTLDTESIVLADVNGDDNLDILVGNFGQNNHLLINRGDGTAFEVFDLPGGTLDTISLAVADVDGDNMIDILVGNDGHPNQLLLNEGNGTYAEAIDLPGNYSSAKSVAAADINNDGLIDIVIGNNEHPNQLLINKDGNGDFEVADLPGGSMNSHSVAIADMDGNGLMDILFGNYGQPNQLLSNQGDGIFTKVRYLPGGVLNTVSIIPGDLNGDGMLDIFVGNVDWNNQVLLFDSCPNSGAKLHSKSWCFKCPTFMGRDLTVNGQKNYFCRECMPDYEQDIRGSEQCELYVPCVLKRRKLGEDSCVRCQDGTYYNNTISRNVNDPSTWGIERCELCPVGMYSSSDPIAINGCFQCKPGTYQPNIGSGSCLACSPGSFQSDFGKEACEPCSKGGYCDAAKETDGGFTACPAGTYNNQTRQSNITACIECPPGTYSTENGAESSVTCLPCPSGTFNDKSGQISCMVCDLGTFQDEEGQESCKSCPSRTYADKTGFEECIACPYRLASTNGSNICPFCAQGFYLNDAYSTISSSDIFQDPFQHCLECPTNGASCETNVSLSELDVKPGYWRHSTRTSTIYPCNDNSNVCRGYKVNVHMENRMEFDDFGDIYCEPGHRGPLCTICSDDRSYFNDNDGQCVKCPSGGKITYVLTGILVGVTAGVIIVAMLFAKFRLQALFQNILTGVSFQAKLKLLVSFCQILSSLEDVYGLRIHSAFTGWMRIISLLSLDLFQIIGIPYSCITISTRQQIALGALWPFMIVLAGAIVVSLYKAYHTMSQSDRNIKSHLRRWTIYGSIVVIYFAIPTVSRSIFDAIKCRAFDDDNYGGFVSYLLVNMEIRCNGTDGDTYAQILVLFWVLFTVWIVLTPLSLLILLIYIQPSVQSKSVTSLADSCRFLWQDYDPSIIYWDVVDTLRKIFLTGLIMLIDRQEGSNKMLRVVIAGVVSVFYSFILLAFHPYQRQDDYNLAFLSNFFLICCLLMGFILKVCGEDDEFIHCNDRSVSFCSKFIGNYFDSYKASLMVILLTFSMLILTTIFMVILAIKKVREPIVCMASTGHPPDLELPKGCSYHMFMSHVWGTGQAQTHAIVRKLQLFMPELKVWLDVDELTDISNLEESVSDSAVFTIYYSDGYFKSKNCQRELYTAIILEKPIIVLYKGDSTEVAEKMIEECTTYCNSLHSPGSSLILERIFGNSYSDIRTSSILKEGPIRWLDGGSAFAAASLEATYYRLLHHLPYYINYPNELSSKGIMVPGELGLVLPQSPINLLVCEGNDGCLELAEELKAIALENNSDNIFTYDAVEYLVNNEGEDLVDGVEDTQGMDSLIAPTTEPRSSTSGRPTFLLLYLNKFTFAQKNTNQQNTDMGMIIGSCINNPNINVILVHEQDTLKGGCKFDEFFKVTPQKLIEAPYRLYSETAIPLYSIEEYHDVSLKLILHKIVMLDKKSMYFSTFMHYGESMKRVWSQMVRESWKLFKTNRRE